MLFGSHLSDVETVSGLDTYSLASASDGTGYTDEVLHHLSAENMWFKRIRSRNDTMSDLPGPGRLQGKLNTALGKHIERSLSACMQRSGFGPHAAVGRLFRNRYLKSILVVYTPDKMLKDCRALIKYTRFVNRP